MGWAGIFGAWRRPRSAARVGAVLYTRKACPLCEKMRAAIDASGVADRLELVVLDVDEDPELRARYDHEVPVLAIEGGETFVARLEPPALARAVDRAARAAARVPRASSRAPAAPARDARREEDTR